MSIPQLNRLIASHETELELLKRQRDEKLAEIEHKAIAIPEVDFDGVLTAVETHQPTLPNVEAIFGMTSGQPFDLH